MKYLISPKSYTLFLSRSLAAGEPGLEMAKEDVSIRTTLQSQYVAKDSDFDRAATDKDDT